MAPEVHAFDWPDRCVVGTVGEPGARTFYLQVRGDGDIVSVALEKQQAAQLAMGIDGVLDELRSEAGNPFSVPSGTPDELLDHEPLDEPVDERFRVGRMTLGWDPSMRQIVVEAMPIAGEDDDEDDPFAAPAEPDELLVVRMPVGSARAFALRARDVVAAGRPLCAICGEPIDADGPHVCRLPDDPS